MLEGRRGAVLGLALFGGLGCFALWSEISAQHNPNSQTPYRAREHVNSYVDLRKPDERLADYTLWLERFTGLLVLVSAVQIGFLIRTDRTARISAEAAAKAAQATERNAQFFKSAQQAHINGGLGGITDDDRIFPTLNNFGNAPAFIHRISVDIQPHDNTLPEEPVYPPGIEPGFLIPPHSQGFNIGQLSVPWNRQAGQLFYGRIWFTDMLAPDDIRISSFILDTGTWLGVVDRPRYWEST